MVEIRSVFAADEFITPDDVRGHYKTLNEAVLAGHWPTLSSSRGKVVFLLDQRPVTPVYLEGHPSLRDRVLFTNSTSGDPDAAFLERNNGPSAEITALVKQGYLIRNPTDSDTKEARINNTAPREPRYPAAHRSSALTTPSTNPPAGMATSSSSCPAASPPAATRQRSR